MPTVNNQPGDFSTLIQSLPSAVEANAQGTSYGDTWKRKDGISEKLFCKYQAGMLGMGWVSSVSITKAIGSSKNAVNSTLKNVLLPQGYVERRKLSERRFEYRWLGKAFEGKSSKPKPKLTSTEILQIQESTIRKCAAHAAKVINQQGPFVCNIHAEILSLIKEL